jgi:hypothetical protein
MTEFRFEWDKVEDVAKSKELGRRYFKDRVVCRFLKQGGDIVLTVWQDGKLVPSFEQAHFKPRSMDRMDIENAQTMKSVFEEFMKAGEQKDEGFPIREWSAVTRAEAENLIGVGISTLEKLAEADDEVLRTFTGGRELKQKAQGWLDDAKDKGIMASKYEKLQKELEGEKDKVAELKRQLAAAQEQVDVLTKAAKTKEK